MEEAVDARYWCHMCSQMVSPIMEIEIKCPFCQSGFVEEMGSNSRDSQDHDSFPDIGSDRALSLWAPILLGMMGNTRRRRRSRRQGSEEDENDRDNGDSEGHHRNESELDQEIDSIMRRRRRSSATILQLLQSLRAAGINTESENSENDRNRERVILINPFNQTIIVQGSYDSNQAEGPNQASVGSLGDYFIGPGLDLLLQHLAENDPNRHGTPPARKDAVEAMPTVAIKENVQCSVCLDDFDMGAEAKEMPCKHKFHSQCILPWLELHSSCPVCRYQMPAEESKGDPDNSQNSTSSGHSGGEEGDEDERHGNGRRFTIPWPFNGLFSSSASTDSSSSAPSSSNAGNGASHANDN